MCDVELLWLRPSDSCTVAYVGTCAAFPTSTFKSTWLWRLLLAEILIKKLLKFLSLLRTKRDVAVNIGIVLESEGRIFQLQMSACPNERANGRWVRETERERRENLVYIKIIETAWEQRRSWEPSHVGVQDFQQSKGTLGAETKVSFCHIDITESTKAKELDELYDRFGSLGVRKIRNSGNRSGRDGSCKWTEGGRR